MAEVESVPTITSAPIVNRVVVEPTVKSVVGEPTSKFPNPNRPDPGPDEAPRAPRQEEWLMIGGEYTGFQVRTWIGVTKKVHDVIGGNTPDQQKYKDALKKVFLEHNNWRDDVGNPYPPCNTDEFWDEIPTRLAYLMVTRLNQRLFKLPDSLVTAGRI